MTSPQDEGALAAERVDANQTLFRQVNDRLRALHTEYAPDGLAGTFLCECADGACSSQIPVPPQVYADVRRYASRFVVAPGHVAEGVERVVEARDGYVVVEKLSRG
jgi:hypothetical protein